MPAIDIDRLVNCVYARPAIWDTTHDAHHNRFILDKLWEEVAKEVGCSKVNVKSKWKYLRDNFRKELAKQPKSESGDTDLEKIRSSWPYFVHLLFLRDQFGAKKPSGAGTEDYLGGDYEEDLSEMLEVSYEDVPGEVQTGNNSPGGSSSFLGESSLEDGTTPVTSGYQLRQRLTRKRPHQPASGELSEELFSVDRQRINRLIREKLTGSSGGGKVDQAEDSSSEDVKFFESLLPHVGRIPPNQKLILRSKIQNLVHEFAYNTSHESETQENRSNVSPQTTNE